VPLVAHTAKASGGAEGLTRAAPRPDLFVVGPAGESESVLPPPDPAEEVAASVPHKVRWLDVDDASLIDHGLREEVAEPLGGVGVVLVQVHRS
jgi:hypothetical protein